VFYLTLCKDRYLVLISQTTIWFDFIKMDAMKFSSLEEIDEFKKKWKDHFFDVDGLKVYEDKQK